MERITTKYQRSIKKASAIFAAASLCLTSLVFALSTTPVQAASPAAYVNAAMADDLGDGLTPATAKRYIQSGITVVDVGGTVYVAAGAYSENITIGKSLALAGAGSSAVTATAANPAASVIMVTASGVSISGFTISGATAGGQAGIYLSGGLSDCNFSNNTLTGNYDGIWLGSGTSNNTLTYNTANSNYQGFEIHISSNNTVANNIANSNTKYGFKIDSGNLNTFSNNTANSNSDKGFYSVAGDGGGSTNSTFTNNTANLNTRHGLHLIGSNVAVTLTGNTFNGNLQTGIKLQDVVTNLAVHENNITNNPIGINVDATVTVTTCAVTYNNLFGNSTFGISNSGTGTLAATKNWWGSATGPTHATNPGGTGDIVSDNVTFIPWLDNSFTTPPAINSINLLEGQSIGGIFTIRVDTSWVVHGLPLEDITQVDFYIDGVLIGIDTTYPYSYDWNTTGYAGPHTVRVVATNVLGITGEMSVNVLNELPYTGK